MEKESKYHESRRKDVSKKQGKAFNSKLDNLLLNKWFYISITIAFITIFGLIFKWGRDIRVFSANHVVNNELLGTYGDFVGGVLGTIFAVMSTLLLIKTFKQQQESTYKNEKLIESQRFNDLFFELLNIYHQEVGELYSQDANTENDYSYTDREFFDFEKRNLQLLYKPQNTIEDSKKESLNRYMDFYIKNKVKVGACFRTLYRIYDLIDHSTLEDSLKIEYSKIIRAQLTESELFFIRYNCMSYYGRPFIKYANKYNVLKHLPTFELLEFKKWWEQLNNQERVGIGIVTSEGIKILKKRLTGKRVNENNVLFKTDPKYKFNMIVTESYKLIISLEINKSNNNRFLEFNGFNKYQDLTIQSLLEWFLKEVFLYSNFTLFNRKEDLLFYSEPITNDGNKTMIKSVVINLNKDKLIVRDPSNEKC